MVKARGTVEKLELVMRDRSFPVPVDGTVLKQGTTEGAPLVALLRLGDEYRVVSAKPHVNRAKRAQIDVFMLVTGDSEEAEQVYLDVLCADGYVQFGDLFRISEGSGLRWIRTITKPVALEAQEAMERLLQADMERCSECGRPEDLRTVCGETRWLKAGGLAKRQPPDRRLCDECYEHYIASLAEDESALVPGREVWVFYPAHTSHFRSLCRPARWLTGKVLTVGCGAIEVRVGRTRGIIPLDRVSLVHRKEGV